MPNAQVLKEKQEAVAEVTAKLKEYVCTIITDYRGLDVSEITALRKLLREAGVEFKVIKNTLATRAAEGAQFAELDSVLKGPTAIAFSKDDAVVAAKILNDFSKKHEHLSVKAGIVEGKVVDAAQIKALAELPSREGLLSMLLSVLQAPVRNFALAVKAVAEKQEGQPQEG